MGAPVGNNNASRGAQLRALINRALSHLDDEAGKPDGTTLQNLVLEWVKEACTDPKVRTEFFDRYYGKPAQTVELDGETADNIRRLVING